MGAVLAGHLTIAMLLAPVYWILRRSFPPADLQHPVFLVLDLLLVSVAAAAGGFVVARIAPRQGGLLAILLAIFMLVGSIGDLMAARNEGRPLWNRLVQLVAMPAAVIAGSRLNQKR